MPPPSNNDPRKCVILVPFLGFIHHECEESLKELERRGYTVRRVGGYAAIDQARNQMASDALRDGFEETLWIDADIAFDPEAVERLRSHSVPMVCGVYPKKGQRAVACNVMPGTPSMLFGEPGGLVELMYAATGFLLVRREVYLAIQDHLRLPTCNEAFGQPLIPFFMPLIQPLETGYWYLAEDYAFCQRARESGIRIFADTTIRLWHIGTYRYGWEDAGIEPKRFSTFTLNFADQRADQTQAAETNNASTLTTSDMDNTPTLAASATNRADGSPERAALRNLAARYAWPSEKPSVPPAPERDWLFTSTKDMLTQTAPRDSRLIVELGSWTGRSTRFLADLAPQATVIAIDHWKGSIEHVQDPELAEFIPRLYETFLSDCWGYRERMIPLRADTVEGMRWIADAGLRPDLIFIDADHQYDSVVADLTTALDLFPGTPIVGDDWDWASVRSAVEAVTGRRNLPVEAAGSAWKIAKHG